MTVSFPHGWRRSAAPHHLCTCTALLAALLLLPALTVHAMPNPVVSVDSPAAFDVLGIWLDAPLEAEDIRYSIIAGQVAQIQFRMGEDEYTWRAARTDNDISGLHDARPGAVELYTLSCGGREVLAQQRAICGGRHATWRWQGISFSLFTPRMTDGRAFTALLLRLAGDACANAR